MKKYLLTAVIAASMAASAQAQKSQIRAAENFYSERDFMKAKAAIDAATVHESTKENVRTWYIRGVVYLALEQQAGSESPDGYYKIAGTSLRKVVSLQPDYEKKDMDNRLFAAAINYFNRGIFLFKGQAYEHAYAHFGEVVDIYSLGEGKRFAANKSFDTVSRQSALYQAYSAYHDSRYNDAFPLLQQAKSDPVVTSPAVYLQLCDIYEVRSDEAGLLATINEGRKAFPADKSLLNRELNFYIKSGKSAELVKRLEDAIQNEPGNAQLIYIAAQTYESMAHPRDKDGKELPAPENYNVLFEKAEHAYLDAVKAAPEEAGYQYGIGAMYFNRGVLTNEQMNAIAGSSSAELKQYDALKAARDSWFSKALPYLNQTISMLDARATSLSGEDRASYIDAIRAAQVIYAKQNNQEKANELKQKFDALQ